MPGLPPLHAVVSSRGSQSADEIRALLQGGVNPRAVDENGRTALHIAAREATGGYDQSAMGLFEALIQGGVPVDARDAKGDTALDIAAFSSNQDGEVMLGGSAEARAAAAPGTLLLYATHHLDEELVRDTLAKGADPDPRDGSKRTPLMRVASYWRSASEDSKKQARRIASLLLKAGADVNAVDHQGVPPLHRAAGDAGLLLLLLDAGADPNAAFGAKTALHEALQVPGNHAIQCVRLLLERGADPRESMSPPRWPALRFALQGIYPKLRPDSTTLPETVALVVAAGGGSPSDLVMAAQDGVTILVEAMLAAGMSPNDQGTCTVSPLVTAVECRREQTARVLVEHGADPTAKTSSGKPLVEVAQEKCGPEFAAWLQGR